MIAAQQTASAVAFDIGVHLERLRRAAGRRRRLESLFASPEFMNKSLDDGRYFRLCAAIAWASEREERAREAVRTDVMVANLRETAAARNFRSA